MCTHTFIEYIYTQTFACLLPARIIFCYINIFRLAGRPRVQVYERADRRISRGCVPVSFIAQCSRISLSRSRAPLLSFFTFLLSVSQSRERFFRRGVASDCFSLSHWCPRFLPSAPFFFIHRSAICGGSVSAPVREKMRLDFSFSRRRGDSRLLCMCSAPVFTVRRIFQYRFILSDSEIIAVYYWYGSEDQDFSKFFEKL